MGLDVLARLLPSLALIVGALLLLRRWSRRAGGGVRPGGGVRVLSRTGVARGAVLAVVAVGERRFLVGAGDHGVSLLGELAAADLDPREPGATELEPAVTPSAPAHATDWRAPTLDRPWMGLVDRLRAMTVRTHLERPIRAPRA